MIKFKKYLTSTVLFTMLVGFSVVPPTNAQMDDQEFQMGRAKEACTNQAK